MLSKEMNERLTRVGPGTPLGNLLRCYWYPIARTPELDVEPVLAVTLLGEHLALYRTDSGKLGLVAQRCAHRGASLAYGIPEEEGLRCPYHGWRYDHTGQCNEQPAEPADSTFKDRIRIPAYPVEELGGFVWAYLGPEPVPLLQPPFGAARQTGPPPPRSRTVRDATRADHAGAEEPSQPRSSKVTSWR